MTRKFSSTNKTTSSKERMNSRIIWETKAYLRNSGRGHKSVRNEHLVESIHYGVIDHLNNSVIPNEDFIVDTQNGRVFDFVADSYSLMRLNWNVAVQKNLVSPEGSAFGNLEMVSSYENPRVKYGEYLGGILQYYNQTHIPNKIGTINIASYEDYVKHFINFILKQRNQAPVTMTRWNTSRVSNIVDTGLAWSYADIQFDNDQEKITQIIDHPAYHYFIDLCLNMGFSVSKNAPNVLIYELNSPATDGIRYSYGLYTLETIFNTRFIKTYTIDNLLLYNNINIYYNKFVNTNPFTRVVKLECGKTTSHYINRNTVEIGRRPYTDAQELEIYCRLRNTEEGSPFEPAKMKRIIKKSKNLLKRVDKAKAMSYINNEFRDQVWNKNYGYHDLRKKLYGKTETQAQVSQVGAGSSSGGSSSSY